MDPSGLVAHAAVDQAGRGFEAGMRLIQTSGDMDIRFLLLSLSSNQKRSCAGNFVGGAKAAPPRPRRTAAEVSHNPD
ncbi:MAG: hypothetical protein OXC54_08995 [Rhodospirillaceae bacterium]|nr:hypothetical protein [Rhodospirillaceae bacterium]MCY4311427.1 hypothetical protein [Rhodospirillaceae bacterium]